MSAFVGTFVARHSRPARIGAIGWLAAGAALFVATPVLAVLAAAFAPAGEVWRHIVATVLLDYTTSSLLLGLIVAAIATTAGAISAWIVVAFSFPGRRILEVALLLPLAIPAYVAGYAWTDLLDVAGPVQTTLRALTGLTYADLPFPPVRTLPGAGFVLGVVLYPYVYLLCRAAFLQQSVCLLEAARTLGMGPWRTFLRVALPLARPALAGGAALVLMETFADFGTVVHFGVQTFTTGIYEAWFGMGDRVAACQLAAMLLGAVTLLLAGERAARGPRRFHPMSTRHPPLRPIRLRGLAGLVAMLACLMPVLLGFLLPVGRLAWMAVEVGDPLPARDFLAFAKHSVTLAIITAGLAVTLGWLVAWGKRAHPGPLLHASATVTGLGYAVPGSVIAVGVLVPLALVDNTLDAWLRARFGVSSGLLLSGTIVALVFAYLARFLAPALAALDGTLARMKPNLVAASRVLGRSPARTAWDVELPLARPGLIAAAVLVFVDTMKELPATLIVRPFDFDTLAVRVYNLAADERLAEASTASLLIVAVGLLPVIVLTRAMRPDSRR